MDTNLHYCRTKVAPDGSDFYYALHFHAQEQQRALLALFTFGAELQFILDTIEDPGVARVKLEWWRQEWVNFSQNRSRHPITQLLAENSLEKADLVSSLEDLIDQTELGLQANDRIEVTHQQRMAVLWRLGGLACGYQNEALLALLEQAARSVERRLLGDSETLLTCLLQEKAPKFSIILTHLRITALKKRQKYGIPAAAPLPELLPIHKLWIAWRYSRH